MISLAVFGEVALLAFQRLDLRQEVRIRICLRAFRVIGWCRCFFFFIIQIEKARLPSIVFRNGDLGLLFRFVDSGEDSLV